MTDYSSFSDSYLGIHRYAAPELHPSVINGETPIGLRLEIWRREAAAFIQNRLITALETDTATLAVVIDDARAVLSTLEPIVANSVPQDCKWLMWFRFFIARAHRMMGHRYRAYRNARLALGVASEMEELGFQFGTGDWKTLVMFIINEADITAAAWKEWEEVRDEHGFYDMSTSEESDDNSCYFDSDDDSDAWQQDDAMEETVRFEGLRLSPSSSGGVRGPLNQSTSSSGTVFPSVSTTRTGRSVTTPPSSDTCSEEQDEGFDADEESDD